MINTTEIAPDVYRFSTYVPEGDLVFNQFLINDDEPVLFHTGMRGIFPLVNEAVARVIDPSRLRWIGFGHFEADECGSLNEWLTIAPNARPFCNAVAAMVSINDFAIREARPMAEEDVLETGKYRFRYISHPHLPHCWEAGSLFEETNRTLFCSDLFHQNGENEPFTEGDVIEKVRDTLASYQAGPLHDYMPYTPKTELNLNRLAALEPRTIAPMHASAFAAREDSFRDLASVMRETLGEQTAEIGTYRSTVSS
jgi:flavorubredoxin